MSGAKIKIRVAAVRVLDESNEASSSEEPYIIVFVADRSKNLGGIAVPSAKTTVFGPWSADEDDLFDDVAGQRSLLGPEVGPRSWRNHPDHLIILAGVMENDDGNPTQGRSLVNGLMAGSLANMAGSNLTRDQMAAQLKIDMDGALSQARMTGIPTSTTASGPSASSVSRRPTSTRPRPRRSARISRSTAATLRVHTGLDSTSFRPDSGPRRRSSTR